MMQMVVNLKKAYDTKGLEIIRTLNKSKPF
jgi:hypothetical protein